MNKMWKKRSRRSTIASTLKCVGHKIRPQNTHTHWHSFCCCCCCCCGRYIEHVKLKFNICNDMCYRLYDKTVKFLVVLCSCEMEFSHENVKVSPIIWFYFYIFLRHPFTRVAFKKSRPQKSIALDKVSIKLKVGRLPAFGFGLVIQFECKMLYTKTQSTMLRSMEKIRRISVFIIEFILFAFRHFTYFILTHSIVASEESIKCVT